MRIFSFPQLFMLINCILDCPQILILTHYFVTNILCEKYDMNTIASAILLIFNTFSPFSASYQAATRELQRIYGADEVARAS